MNFLGFAIEFYKRQFCNSAIPDWGSIIWRLYRDKRKLKTYILTESIFHYLLHTAHNAMYLSVYGMCKIVKLWFQSNRMGAN